MNGKCLNRSEVEQWLLHGSSQSSQSNNNNKSSKLSSKKSFMIHNADLIILSLQECPTYPTHDDYLESKETERGNFPCIMTMGPPKEDTKREIDTLPSLIQQVLSASSHNIKDDVMNKNDRDSSHTLIADIAMGEKPTLFESPSKKRELNDLNRNDIKVDQWYGFIRLIVFAKRDLAEYINNTTSQEKKRNPVIPILVPTGHKRISTYLDENTSTNRIYETPKKSSPDKGGVCLVIPSLNLFICSLHLCGTNKYHTLESKFDKIRIDQLKAIGEKCQEVLSLSHNHENNENLSPLSPSFENCSKVVLGDLNFRVEICANEIDKGRGGPDCQQVHNILQSNSIDKLHELFWTHDRLVQLLSQKGNASLLNQSLIEGKSINGESNDIPLLQGMEDVFMCHYNRLPNKTGSKMNIFPTFTFKIESQDNLTCANKLDAVMGRKYSDKRTPSWTDRILIENNFLKNNSFDVSFLQANYNIFTSDHAPLTCMLERIKQ